LDTESSFWISRGVIGTSHAAKVVTLVHRTWHHATELSTFGGGRYRRGLATSRRFTPFCRRSAAVLASHRVLAVLAFGRILSVFEIVLCCEPVRRHRYYLHNILIAFFRAPERCSPTRSRASVYAIRVSASLRRITIRLSLLQGARTTVPPPRFHAPLPFVRRFREVNPSRLLRCVRLPPKYYVRYSVVEMTQDKGRDVLNNSDFLIIRIIQIFWYHHIILLTNSCHPSVPSPPTLFEHWRYHDQRITTVSRQPA